MYECSEYMCCGGSKTNRSFLTKEEKIEMLEEYKKALDRESQGVEERMAQLTKEK